MLRGVNKQIIEINSTDNAYFEKAVFYVRPEYADENAEKLQADAESFLNDALFCTVMTEPRKKHRLSTKKSLLIISVAAFISVAAAVIITVI